MPSTKSSNTLVVVDDGHRAMLFRDEGSGERLLLREERRITPHDLLNDGPSGARPTEQWAKQTDEATFAKQLANTLYKMKHAGEVDTMILAADPQTLGQLRAAMHKSVETSIVRSVSKELTNHQTQDIASALAA